MVYRCRYDEYLSRRALPASSHGYCSQSLKLATVQEVTMAWTALLSEQLEHLTSRLGITYEDLAQILGTDRKTVYRWIADETFPQPHNRARLDALEVLVDRLVESFKTPEGVSSWLQAESGYFGGLRPIDALLRGRIDAVEAALEALDSGIFV
jgi:hypothetical protein